MSADYFVVRLFDGALWAVPLTRVAETLAIEKSAICSLPGVDPALLGVINQRGQLLWVMELQVALGTPALVPNSRPDATLTLLELGHSSATSHSVSGNARLACVVADLVEIVAFNAETFIPPSEKIFAQLGCSERGRSLLRGVTEYRSETVAVLDADALFDALHHSHSPRSLVHS
ncbi:MAG: chemotaxis protein CheW [Cyanobacteria bacterium J06642_2]